MGIWDKVKSGFGGKDKTAAQATEQPAAAQEAEQSTTEQEKIRDAGATSNEELYMALEKCKASLGNIENLDDQTIEDATTLLNECEHLIQGMHAQADIKDLNQMLLEVINDSLINFFKYGKFDVDAPEGQPSWKDALDLLKECIKARTKEEGEIYSARITLEILSLRALNCSLFLDIVTQRIRIAETKKQYREYCKKNNISDIGDETDASHLIQITIMLNKIEHADSIIDNKDKLCKTNTANIRLLDEALEAHKTKKVLLSEDHYARIDELIAKAANDIEQLNRQVIERQKAVEKQIAEDEQIREEAKRGQLTATPVISKEKRQLSQKLLHPEMQEEVVTNQKSQQVVEEPLTE